jgi:hypothetical protein
MQITPYWVSFLTDEAKKIHHQTGLEALNIISRMATGK